jgi:hypothetical protein
VASWELPGGFLRVSLDLPWGFLGASWGLPGFFLWASWGLRNYIAKKGYCQTLFGFKVLGKKLFFRKRPDQKKFFWTPCCSVCPKRVEGNNSENLDVL